MELAFVGPMYHFLYKYVINWNIIEDFNMHKVTDIMDFLPVFTEEPNKLGWNNSTVVQENEQDADEFEDHIGGKSFDAFESKLQQGFLEARNLGLVSAPPAIFDYQPPLEVTIYVYCFFNW